MICLIIFKEINIIITDNLIVSFIFPPEICKKIAFFFYD